MLFSLINALYFASNFSPWRSTLPPEIRSEMAVFHSRSGMPVAATMSALARQAVRVVK